MVYLLLVLSRETVAMNVSYSSTCEKTSYGTYIAQYCVASIMVHTYPTYNINCLPIVHTVCYITYITAVSSITSSQSHHHDGWPIASPVMFWAGKQNSRRTCYKCRVLGSTQSKAKCKAYPSIHASMQYIQDLLTNIINRL